MAAIALPRPIAPHRSRSPSPLPPTLSPSLHIDKLNTSAACPIPIPNKHIPVCPPGPAPSNKPDTPPASPPINQSDSDSNSDLHVFSLLYPPDNYGEIVSDVSKIYTIDAAGVFAALNYRASQPLPDQSLVFPWLHGLHPHNHIQQAFFIARRKALRRTPRCLRGITIVKAGGDLSCSRLRGAIAPDEFLNFGRTVEFKDVDPREGFSVRNFQIQAAKSAMVSDLIVYGDDEDKVRRLAWDISNAQQSLRDTHARLSQELPRFNTFVCTSPFEEFENDYPQIVSTNSKGQMTGKIMDFFHSERVEMSTMTSASEISSNVWLGPTPDPSVDVSTPDGPSTDFDVYIECNDLSRLNPTALKAVAEELDDQHVDRAYLEFPSSGSILPPSWSLTEADGVVETCRWIYHLATGSRPAAMESEALDTDGDTPTRSSPIVTRKPRRVLIHCTDGYTETSMLALSYYIYSTGVPVWDAWLQLHTKKHRNFFAYPSDVAFLTSICPRLLEHSPALAAAPNTIVADTIGQEPKWLTNMDGSLPSRILDYMYLGNLGHANNPELLRAMGIGQILSVGELATWQDNEQKNWDDCNVCVIKGVQDNGVDPLTSEFEKCLEFIDRGRLAKTATLVHCRVGVSRSATICIAEVMRALELSFPRAYCYVRARRLNVIIQPHLRFTYELLKWEEVMQSRRGEKIHRELEWAEIAREIAAMNRPYSR